MTDSLHKLGDVLRSAREAKEIDLARVERDTKIRTRYLEALEAGDYRELPGAVYTKGFLRNYGAYLGLDPEYLTDLYRLETDGAVVEAPSPAPPRPLKVRRARALVLTPGVLAAAILTVAVVAFVGYLVYEFVTFARTPTLQISAPAGDVAGWRGSSYTIVGTTEPNAGITVDVGGTRTLTATADAKGAFSITVSLVPGSNVITLVANDPVTHRDSPQVSRTIVVDLSTPSPTPGPRVVLTAPADGATVSGPVKVTGTAVAGSVVHVTASLTKAASPGFTISDPYGQTIKVPKPKAGATVEADTTAEADGTFSATLALAPGDWEIGLIPGGPGASPSEAASPSGAATPAPSPAVTSAVTVTPGSGLKATLAIAGGPCYVLVLEDNVALSGVSGRTIPAGRTITMSAKRTLLIRAGNAGAATLTVNGVRIGKMGRSGQVVEWHITTGG